MTYTSSPEQTLLGSLPTAVTVVSPAETALANVARSAFAATVTSDFPRQFSNRSPVKAVGQENAWISFLKGAAPSVAPSTDDEIVAPADGSAMRRGTSP